MNFPTVRLPQHDGEGAVLLEDWRIDLDYNGKWFLSLVVPSGTQTDGASIPRFLWRVCGHPLQHPRVYAALVHDWIYGGNVPTMTRATADSIYRDLLIRFGWGKVKAYTEYYALRIFGGGHWCE